MTETPKTWRWHLPAEVARHRLSLPGERREFPPVASFRHPISADTICHRLIGKCCEGIVSGQHPRTDLIEIVKVRLREREVA